MSKLHEPKDYINVNITKGDYVALFLFSSIQGSWSLCNYYSFTEIWDYFEENGSDVDKAMDFTLGITPKKLHKLIDSKKKSLEIFDRLFNPKQSNKVAITKANNKEDV